MQKNLMAVLMAICLCSLTQGHGQSVQPQPQPLVRLPDQGGHWVVQFKPPMPAHPPKPSVSGTTAGQAPGDAPVIVTFIDVVSSGNLRRDKILWSNGTSSEFWNIKGDWLVQIRDRDIVGFGLLIDHQYKGWQPLTSSLLQGIATTGTSSISKYHGATAVLYRARRAVKLPDFPMTGHLTLVAVELYVNPKSLYPIAYRDQDGDYIFSDITEGITQPLVAPDRFLHEAKRTQDARYIPPPPRHL